MTKPAAKTVGFVFQFVRKLVMTASDVFAIMQRFTDAL